MDWGFVRMAHSLQTLFLHATFSTAINIFKTLGIKRCTSIKKAKLELVSKYDLAAITLQGSRAVAATAGGLGSPLRSAHG